MVVPKLKAKLEVSVSSLKTALEVADTCREEMQKNDRLAKEEQETLKTTLTKVMAERDQLVKEKVHSEAKEKSLANEVEKCQEFMLCINEERFYQGIQQAAFFHGVPSEDSRYDLEKDVVNNQLVSLGGAADHTMEDPQQIEATQPKQSVEDII